MVTVRVKGLWTTGKMHYRVYSWTPQQDVSVPLCAKHLEEEGEDVNDIQVDVEGGKDVLLWTNGVALVAHQQLGVECKELEQREEAVRECFRKSRW